MATSVRRALRTAAVLALAVAVAVVAPGAVAEASPILAATSERRLLTDDRKILAIVGGLVVVALALTLVTVRYWRITNPVPVRRPSRGGRRVANQTTEGDDPSAGEVEPDGAPEAAPDSEPAAATAARVLASGRPSRRAVTGADHRGADEDWEPRGTGEHARVETARLTSARPSRAGRRAVLGSPTDDT